MKLLTDYERVKKHKQCNNEYGRRCINSKHSNMIKHIHTTARNQADVQTILGRRRVGNKGREDKQFRKMWNKTSIYDDYCNNDVIS